MTNLDLNTLVLIVASLAAVVLLQPAGQSRQSGPPQPQPALRVGPAVPAAGNEACVPTKPALRELESRSSRR